MNNTLSSSPSYERWELLPKYPELSPRALQNTTEYQSRADRAIERFIAEEYQKKYRFTVFHSVSIEVMHTQDRHIYIPTALIKITPNTESLAFILAHEIAHWENGDIKNNHAKIPASPGQIHDAECAADELALKKILSDNASREKIKQWLQELKEEHGR